MTAPTTLRAMTLASDLPFELKPIKDITDSLPKNPKGDWLHMPTMRKDGMLDTGPRSYEDIRYISVHHTATERGVPEGHARYHISKVSKNTPDGYGGIAYHIYIKGDQIYQVNDLLALTWHTQGRNHDSIGISIEANFAKRDITDTERHCLYGAIITVMQMFNIPIENVRGHKEYYSGTACPVIDMNRVRKEVADIAIEMAYRKSYDYVTMEIAEHYARVKQLYDMVVQKSQYADAARRKLFTGSKLYKQYELDDPMKVGKLLL